MANVRATKIRIPSRVHVQAPSATSCVLHGYIREVNVFVGNSARLT